MKNILFTGILMIGFFCTINLTAEHDSRGKSNKNEGFYVGAIGGLNWLVKDHSYASGWISNDYFIYKDRIRFATDTKIGYFAGGIIGYKASPFYSCSFVSISPRIEGEISYRHNTSSHWWYSVVSKELRNPGIHGRITSISYMANVLVDINLNMSITPYMGFGAGYAQGFTKIHSIGRTWRGKSSRFAYQGICGLSCPICEKVEVSLDYRYLVADKHAADQSLSFGIKRYF
jgi:opacity protein-like surface antigen